MDNVPAIDYFTFFDLPLSFIIDEKVLKKKYYENSRKYHPDFFTQADEVGQEEALMLSTFNNNAYSTLSDIDKRIKYILQIKKKMAGRGTISTVSGVLISNDGHQRGFDGIGI